LLLLAQPKTGNAMPNRFRILHISDLHSGKEGAGAQWRERRVLGEHWLANLRAILEDGQPDIVCFTGDLAQSGAAQEYEVVSQFLDATLAELKMDRAQLFVVPGNHDIARGTNKADWTALRDASWQIAPQALSRWMAGGKTPFGCTEAWRELVLARQQNYRAWLARYWPERPAHYAGAHVGGGHPHLGYRHTLAGSTPLHIIGLDSAWLAGDDNDAGKLQLTEDQIARHLTLDDGGELDGIKIVLLHHPLGELGDGKNARALLAEYGTDLLLHGHVHDPDYQRWQHPNHAHGLRESSAGCLYEHDRYPNSMQVIDLALPSCQVRQIWLRTWSGKGHWYSDNQHFAGSRDGRLIFEVDEETDGGGGETGFIPRTLFGRANEMADLQRAFFPASGEVKPVALCCAVEGMPGVGKTHLAEAFIREHWAQGREMADCHVRLYLSEASRPDAVVLAQEIAGKLKLAVSGKQVFKALAAHLQQENRLLLIENVDSPALAQAVAALVAQLPGCPILLTARYRDLGRTQGWARVEVRELVPAAALALLRSEAPACAASDAQLQQLAQKLGYLPLALHIAASHLAMGYSPAWFLDQLQKNYGISYGDEAEASLHGGDANQRARAILASSFAISWQSWQCMRELSDAQRNGLTALAHGPAEGCGAVLGAALAGLQAADEISAAECIEYEGMCMAARRLSLLRYEQGQVIFHALLQQWLRQQTADQQQVAETRWQAWLLARLPLPASIEDYLAWHQLQAEEGALVEWLERCAVPEALALDAVGSWYANQRGPFTSWLQFCARVLPLLDAEEVGRSNLYWIQGHAAWRCGELDLAMQAAKDLHQFESKRGNERETVLALGLQADILTARGELDEALLIRREEQMPVYEKLKDVRLRAVTQGKIADILTARGELDEALRIRREEEMPVYEKLKDVRSRAITQGKIAYILTVRGELGEALRIYREEEMPVYEKLKDVRSLLVARNNLAAALIRRAKAGDFEESRQLLLLALAEAQRLRLPEVATIEYWLKKLPPVA
jgi:predicted phosphodiesterase